MRNTGRVEADSEIEGDRSRLGQERELVAATAWLGEADGVGGLEEAHPASAGAYKPGASDGFGGIWSGRSLEPAGRPGLRVDPPLARLE